MEIRELAGIGEAISTVRSIVLADGKGPQEVAARLRVLEVRRIVLELLFQSLERRIDAKRMAAEAAKCNARLAGEVAGLELPQLRSLEANRDRYLLLGAWYAEQASQCEMEARAHYDRLVGSPGPEQLAVHSRAWAWVLSLPLRLRR